MLALKHRNIRWQAGVTSKLSMFLGRLEEAKALYLRCRDERTDGQNGARHHSNDLASLCRRDLSHPIMDEIETLFTAGKISR